MTQLRAVTINLSFDELNEAEHFFHSIVWNEERMNAYVQSMFPHIKNYKIVTKDINGDGYDVSLNLLIETPDKIPFFDVGDYTDVSGAIDEDLPF